MSIDYACGWALSEDYKECTMQILLDKADSYMYDNKQLCKQQFCYIYHCRAFVVPEKYCSSCQRSAEIQAESTGGDRCLPSWSGRRASPRGDYVTRVLIDNIVNVHLEPGEKLLENDLSGQLGVSRTPYREAVLCACGAAARADKTEERHLCVAH